jgi:uncharacterized protein YjbJ (UPF0337 family)
MSRKERKKGRVVDEIRESAKEIAGQSGDALKGFADETGSAAKEFAGKTRDAAKELVEAIEKAAQRVEPQRSRHRGRKLLGTLTIIGIGVAVIANEKLREALGGAVRRDHQPSWEPRVPDIRNGEVAESTETTKA